VSLTETEEIFISIREDALNDLITATVTDRPRLLVYGSPGFVPVTTVSETRMDPIPFPGVAGGIEWRIRFSHPQIDLYEQDLPLPPELTLAPGQLSARINVELCLDCRQKRIDPKRKPQDHDRPRMGQATCCRLEVFVIGHLRRTIANGEDAITFEVDSVEIVDVAPDEVETLLECLLFMILQAVLATIRLPLRALQVGAFSLSVAQGPLIEDNQVKARGSFV
jgi:hypothetical protein